MDRRRYLRMGGAALAAALAGCGQGDGTDTERPPGDGESTPSPASADDTPTDAVETAALDATPTSSPEPTGTPPSSPTPRDAAQVVAVADGSAVFDPETFEIATSETVVWVWRGSGHNVRATSRPRGSTFTGTPGGDETTYDEGYTFSHTFEVAGEYEYRCYPYRNLGMTGSFTVND